MVGLGFLSGYASNDALAVNSDGSVVVGVTGASGTTEAAFRWTAADGMRSIKDLLSAAGVNTAGWIVRRAFAVSNDGTTIVGEGTDPSGRTQAWIAHIPVSSTRVSTHDFNGDGTSDILWRDTSGNTAIWFMNGTSSIGGGSLGTVPTSWSIVGQRDFNGDGKSDTLWRDTSGNVAMWLMNGTSMLGGALSARCQPVGLSSALAILTAMARATFSGATPAATPRSGL
jgi:uncharacterized membrane protein